MMGTAHWDDAWISNPESLESALFGCEMSMQNLQQIVETPSKNPSGEWALRKRVNAVQDAFKSLHTVRVIMQKCRDGVEDGRFERTSTMLENLAFAKLVLDTHLIVLECLVDRFMRGVNYRPVQSALLFRRNFNVLMRVFREQLEELNENMWSTMLGGVDLDDDAAIARAIEKLSVDRSKM